MSSHTMTTSEGSMVIRDVIYFEKLNENEKQKNGITAGKNWGQSSIWDVRQQSTILFWGKDNREDRRLEKSKGRIQIALKPLARKDVSSEQTNKRKISGRDSDRVMEEFCFDSFC